MRNKMLVKEGYKMHLDLFLKLFLNLFLDLFFRIQFPFLKTTNRNILVTFENVHFITSNGLSFI